MEAVAAPAALRRFAWGVLAYNLAVIVWGAFVRATGSGAGCGEHWPLCNGVLVPRAPELQTLIELTHRMTSGLALLSAVVLWGWAARATTRGHPMRGPALASLCLMIVEALLGAGLVLLGLVAQNDSLARAGAMSLHLVNTLLLVAALALTGWSAGGRRVRLAGVGSGFGGAVALFLVLGVSGAVAALGDTLFPAQSLQEGLREDFSPTAHLLVRLRAVHPVLAVGMAVYLGALGLSTLRRAPSEAARRAALWLWGLTGLQMVIGVVNLLLLAPVWLQLVHLLAADGVWLALVLLGAELGAQGEEARTSAVAPSAVPLSS
jgi:heme a synthase